MQHIFHGWTSTIGWVHAALLMVKTAEVGLEALLSSSTISTRPTYRAPVRSFVAHRYGPTLWKIFRIILGPSSAISRLTFPHVLLSQRQTRGALIIECCAYETEAVEVDLMNMNYFGRDCSILVVCSRYGQDKQGCVQLIRVQLNACSDTTKDPCTLIDIQWAELIFPHRRGHPRPCLCSLFDILQKYRGDALLKISRAIPESVLNSLIGIQVTPFVCVQ
jgi:hypothetical protein